MGKNIDELVHELTLEEKISLIHGNGLFCTAAIERLGIPALRMSDGPSGIRQEFKNDEWTPIGNTSDQVSWLPSNTCLASTWNPELAFYYGQVLGNEARGRGKDVILAPGINIKRTPLCGRNFEYMSEDPALITSLAVSVIHGIQENDVAACVKHYALNNQEWDRMSYEVDIDERTLRELYLPAFRSAVTEGGSLSIMGAYNQYNGEFCCENTRLLQTILRDEWGYDGVTISDWGGVHHTNEAALHGLDLEMSVTPDFDEYKMANPLLKKVKAGEIPESIIDEKVRRILQLITTLRVCSPERKRGQFNTHAHHLIIQRIAQEGIILLKNEKNHLPLSRVKKILVVGDNANRTHAQGGGSAEVKAMYDISPLLGIQMETGGNTQCDWLPGYYVDNEQNVIGDVDWQADSLQVDYTIKDNQETFEKMIRPKQKEYLAKVLAAVPNYDEVVFIGGLNHAFDVEGFDRPDMKLPYGQDEVISALADATDNLTVVLINGSPVEMPWIDKVHSLIQTSYCGMNGGFAIARVLFGEINPSGKLPETYPICLADTPTAVYDSYPGVVMEDGHRLVTYKEKLMVGYRYYVTKNKPVLFPFGYGLSYTDFTFTNFHVVMRNMESIHELQITVSCEIQNTGKLTGKETLQLYIGLPGDDQPKMVLRAFEKVEVQPTEKKEISLIATQKDFATYSLEKKCFIAKPGTYSLYAGTSANDILYETTIDIMEEFILD